MVLVVHPPGRTGGAGPLPAPSAISGLGGEQEPGPPQPWPQPLPVLALWFLFCAGKMKLHNCVGSGNKVRISECALSLIYLFFLKNIKVALNRGVSLQHGVRFHFQIFFFNILELMLF